MDAAERIQKQNEQLVNKLEAFGEGFKVFADSIGEQEQDEEGFNYFLYSTGDFSAPEGDSIQYQMTQSVYVVFTSENRDFIDGDILKIIKLIRSAKLAVTLVEKDHRQLDKQDRYVDVVVFECKRVVKIGC